jgi:hypothetical protein
MTRFEKLLLLSSDIDTVPESLNLVQYQMVGSDILEMLQLRQAEESPTQTKLGRLLPPPDQMHLIFHRRNIANGAIPVHPRKITSPFAHDSFHFDSQLFSVF